MVDILGLKDKVVVMVGGGFGMGEISSLQFAEAGANVAIVDLSEERAEAVAAQVRALGRKAVVVATNVLDVSAAPAAIAKIEAELGPIDVLTTIVGQAEVIPALDMTPEIWDHDFSRNVRYFFFWAQAAAKAMIKSGKGGCITAVGSIAGMNSGPGHVAYAASKGALHNTIRSLSVEFAPHNIRINVVAPGVIATPRIMAGKDYAAWEDRIKNSIIPAQRLATPKEITDAILYLSSDMATYVTGATLAVDGGFTAQWVLGNGAREKGSGK